MQKIKEYGEDGGGVYAHARGESNVILVIFSTNNTTTGLSNDHVFNCIFFCWKRFIL